MTARTALATLMISTLLLAACGINQPLRAEEQQQTAASAQASSRFQPVKPSEVDPGMPYNVPEVPVKNPHALDGVHIAIVAAHGFEEVEVTYPLTYLEARGAQVDVISPDWIKGRVMAVRFLKPSVWIPVTKNISQAKVDDYQAILVPGGAWNPVIMRTDDAVLGFVKSAFSKGKLVASLCHGPQVLLSAGILKGLEVTGVSDIRGDLRNGGAHVIEDKPLVISKNVLTSRDPHDLAEFSQGIEQYLTAGKRTGTKR